MNSREIVRRTLEFDCPERVARSFDESDFVWASCQMQTSGTDWREIQAGVWERIDEWGNTWRRLNATSKGEVHKGVLDNIEDAVKYSFPDFSNPADYAHAAEVRKQNPDKWVIGGMPGFAFNIARKLRRLDNYLTEILTDADKIHALHDRIDHFLADIIRNYAQVGVDAVMFPEDWGTQQQTMISPRLWRQEFFPRFCDLCGLAHSLGLKVFMHSCGKMTAIIPGLMEAGVDLLQFDQCELHGLETLAGFQEQGKLTYWGPVDIQKCLPTGDEIIIRAKAEEMLSKLWRKRGGFVAGYYSDTVSIGIQPEWQEWACQTFLDKGR